MTNDLISLEPSESNPFSGDIVVFKDDGYQWEVKRVIAPNVYLRSVEGNRFAVYPIAGIKLIWRDAKRKADIDFTQYYEGLALA